MSQQSQQHIPYLDGWRGVAIILVLICHFGNREYAKIGEFGVQMFFVLSGFLMSRLLFIRQVKINDFFAKRFSRIVPTFWLYIICVAIYASIFQPEIYKVSFKELSSTLFFLRTYFPAAMNIWDERWPIGHVWSLNVEEHSYIYLAALALVCRYIKFRHAPTIFLLGSTLVVFGIGVQYGMHGAPSGASPWSTRTECAALGLISAAALRVVREKSTIGWIQRVSPLLPVLAFAIAILCFTSDIQKGSNKLIAPLFLAFAITYLDVVPMIIKRFLAWPVLCWFGTCSFSLYLWQHPFFVATQHFGLSSLAGGALAIMVGTLSFYSFENPIRLRLNRAWESRKANRIIMVKMAEQTTV